MHSDEIKGSLFYDKEQKYKKLKPQYTSPQEHHFLYDADDAVIILFYANRISAFYLVYCKILVVRRAKSCIQNLISTLSYPDLMWVRFLNLLLNLYYCRFQFVFFFSTVNSHSNSSARNRNLIIILIHPLSFFLFHIMAMICATFGY